MLQKFSGLFIRLKSNLFSSPEAVWQFIFICLSFFTCIAMVILSFDYGIIWDEWIQSHYGKLVLKFLLSGGQDQSVLTFGKTMYLYGGFFDTITAVLYGLIFDSMRNVANYPIDQDLIAPHWHSLRHVVNSLFGFTAILFTGLTARKIAGWRAGTLAFIFLLFSPRFFGNSMNNPKDIPFAMGAAIFLYYFIQLLKQLPSPSRRVMIGTGVGIAIAINIKIGGILFLAYTYLFCGLIWLNFKLYLKKDFSFLKLLQVLIPVSLIAYLGGLIFWPFGMMNPVLNPLHALTAFNTFGGNEGTLLFEGLTYHNGTTPWYYIPKWILISSPFFFVLGLFLFIACGKSILKQWSKKSIYLILFCCAFPITWAITTKTIVYDSWRHFIFIYPPLIILAVLAWEHLWLQCHSFTKKAAISTILIFLLADPLTWMVRNHPNEYVYFNSLVGGIRGAQGQYETDYWGNCLREASEGFIAEFKKSNNPSSIVIRADGEPISTMPFLIRGLGAYYIPYDPAKNHWDFSIEIPRFKDPQSLKDQSWPGSNAVYTVYAERTPLCAVIQRPNSKIAE